MLLKTTIKEQLLTINCFTKFTLKKTQENLTMGYSDFNFTFVNLVGDILQTNKDEKFIEILNKNDVKYSLCEKFITLSISNPTMSVNVNNNCFWLLGEI